MITTHAGLAAAREALANLEDALLDLNRNRHKYHPATFAVMVEPIEAEIRRLRGEIDGYISPAPAISGEGVPPAVPAV